MNSEEKEELIIVFKEAVTELRAQEMMESFSVKYREGMDSSRGKIYFYSTGNKYIITFPSSDAKMEFLGKQYGFLPEIHEIYHPDWDKAKD